MIQFFRKIADDISDIKNFLKQPSVSEMSLELLRRNLAMLPAFVSKAEKDPTSHGAYLGLVAAMMPHLEADLREMELGQLEFGSNQSLNFDQVLMSRGTINGINLVLEYYRLKYGEYLDKSQNPEGGVSFKKIVRESMLKTLNISGGDQGEK